MKIDFLDLIVAVEEGLKAIIELGVELKKIQKLEAAAIIIKRRV